MNRLTSHPFTAPCAVALLACIILMADHASAQYARKVIMYSGQPAPGANGAVFAGDYNSGTPGVSPPIPIGIAEDGSALFGAFLTGGDAGPGSNSGLWLWKEGELSLIVRSGDPVPSIPGATIRPDLDRAWIQDDGRISFVAAIHEGVPFRLGYFTLENGSPVLQFTVESPIEGGFAIEPTGFTVHFVNDGLVILTSRITGPGVQGNVSDFAVLAYDTSTGVLSIVARQDSPLPSPLSGYRYSSTMTPRALGPEGDLIINLIGVTSQTASHSQVDGLFRWSNGVMSIIESSEIGPVNGFPPNSLNSSAHVIAGHSPLFQRTAYDGLESPPIFRENMPGSPLFEAGETPPFGNAAFETFGNLHNSPEVRFGQFDDGRAFASGTLTSGRTGIWVTDEADELVTIVQSGWRVPGFNGNATIFRMRPPLMWPSRNGKIAFVADVELPPSFDVYNGLWVGDRETYDYVVAENDLIEVAEGDVREVRQIGNLGFMPSRRTARLYGRTGTDGQPGRFSSNGELFVYVAFNGLKGNALFIASENRLVVNTTDDSEDMNPGDGNCDTGSTVTCGSSDEPACSLRAAIMESNAVSELSEVSFDIPGPGPFTIAFDEFPPDIETPISLDATTQPGYVNSPVVELTPAGVSYGLNLTGGGSTIRGFAMYGFEGPALILNGAGSSRVESNVIGTNAAGVNLLGNGTGILVSSSQSNVIGGVSASAGNVISGNVDAGIRIVGAASTANVIQGNLIGPAPDGTPSLTSTGPGIDLGEESSATLIGGTGSEAGNVISDNTGPGIRIADSGSNVIIGNVIGTEPDGSCVLSNEGACPSGNGASGIMMTGASPGNQVGLKNPGVGNLISGNTGAGIELADGEFEGSSMEGNTIGTDGVGTSPLPNGTDGILIRDASGIEIGSSAASGGNLISDNHGHGIHIRGAESTDISIMGNRIGRDDGFNLFLNGGRGIRVATLASNVRIGTNEEADANFISGGIQVSDYATRVTVRRNIVEIPGVWLNQLEDMRVPLQLSETGPACNPWIGGSGPNQGIAPPRLTRLGTTFIEGVSRPGDTVDIYRAQVDIRPYGRYFPYRLDPVASTTADATGFFQADIEVPAGEYISVTATDESGNTSEFSQLKRPVIVAPGIGGSWLSGANGDDIWLPLSGLHELTDRLARMAMNPDGTEAENLSEDGILELIPPEGKILFLPPEYYASQVYGELTQALQSAGYAGEVTAWTRSDARIFSGETMEIDLWRFPTDWRLSQRDLANDLRDRIEWLTEGNIRVARSCEVDIVSHSNGGVIAASYVKSHREHARNRVHRLITSGTPYLGSVQAMTAHTRGYVFELEKNLKFVSPYWGPMIEMARNLPATYSLLPPPAYWQASRQFEIGSSSILEDLNGTPLSSFQEVFDFMTADKPALGLGRNGALWTQVNQAVNLPISDWRSYDGPPHIYRHVGNTVFADLESKRTVVGWYNNPLSMRRRLQDEDLRSEPGDLPIHTLYRAAQNPIFGLGDHTVPLSSATLGRDERVGNVDFSGVERPDGSNNPWIEEFNVFPCSHLDLVAESCLYESSPGVEKKALDRIVEILESGYLTNPAERRGPQLGKRSPGTAMDENILVASTDAPVEFHVYDQDGVHTGPVTLDGVDGVEFLIDELGYEATEYAAVIALPDVRSYTISGIATEDETTIRFVRMMLRDDDQGSHVLFPDLLVHAGGGFSFEVQNGGTPAEAELSVDADGDGVAELSVSPSETVASAGGVPAVPAPEPFRIVEIVDSGSTDNINVPLVFRRGSTPDWSWQAAVSADWLELAATEGGVTTPVQPTINPASLSDGVYRDTVSLSVSLGDYSVTYGVPVELIIGGAPALAAIHVEPGDAEVTPGDTVRFTALGSDQFGHPFAVTTTWTAGGGTIDSDGLYTAGQLPGVYQIVATEPATDLSGTVLITIAENTSRSSADRDVPPSTFKLHDPYPHPVKTRATIPYDVARTSSVRIELFDVMGRLRQVLVDGTRSAGRYRVDLPAADLSPGLYIVRLEAEAGSFTKTVVIVR